MLDKRCHRALVVTILGLASGLFLSWPLWTGDHTFPSFPLFSRFPVFPAPFGVLFIIGFLAQLGFLCIRPNRIWFISVLISMLILGLQDQQRWQPWFYQYGLMLLPFAFLSRNRTENERTSLVAILRLILIGVYFWGGLHKCHSGFISVYENSLMAPILRVIESPFLITSIIYFGYLIPPIEILMAIGLIFKATRKVSLYAVIGTHLVILILLGPVKGEISNSVVWPWNFTMMALAYLLFSNDESLRLPTVWKSKLRQPAIAIILLMFPAPLLFHFDAWDRYLSFNLYSGQQKRMLIKIDAKALPAIPEEWTPYLIDPQAPDQHRILSPSRWAIMELNTPFVSEWRLLRAFAHYTKDALPPESPPVFYVDYRHLPHKSKRHYSVLEIDQMK